MPWIVFFQNVDAIIGHEEAVIYPEHLTQELDYELELAVVLKKTGKHFAPEDAGDYIGGYVIFKENTPPGMSRPGGKTRGVRLCQGTRPIFPLGPVGGTSE